MGSRDFLDRHDAAAANDGKGGHRRRAGVVVSYVNSVASMVVNLLYIPLLLGGIGQGEYGLYQLIGSIMAYITIMNSILSGGTTRFYCSAYAEGDREGMERVLATCRLIYAVATAVVLVVGAACCAGFSVVYANSLTPWQVSEGRAMLCILVINMIVTMHNTISVAIINANERFVFLKGSQLVVTVMQPFTILFAMRFWPYAITIVSVQLVLNLLLALVQWYFSRRVLGGRVEMHGLDKVLMRSIAVFSGGILLACIADQIFWKTNQLVLGFYFGADVVAVYGVANQIYTAYLTLGNVISSVFMSRVSQLFAARDIKGISDLFARVGRLGLYVLMLVYGGFLTLGRDFIELWAGPGYYDAYLIASFIMFSFTLDSAQSLGITILQVVDKYRYRAHIYLVLAVLNVAIVLPATPYIGGVGCAAVTSALMLVGNGLVMNVYYHKGVGLDMLDWWRNAFRVIAPTAVYALVATALWRLLAPPLAWTWLLAGVVAYTIGYAVLSWFVCFNDYERGLAKFALGRAHGRA